MASHVSCRRGEVTYFLHQAGEQEMGSSRRFLPAGLEKQSPYIRLLVQLSSNDGFPSTQVNSQKAHLHCFFFSQMRGRSEGSC